MKVCESPNTFSESPTDRIFAFCSNVQSPEEKEKIGNEKKQSAYRQTTTLSSVILPNYLGHKDVEGN
ncbi:hypothetical protein H5410_047060 [Solanum commersonii]|uniref:Uncharacterized protein n=1 Tax=Solanum commersonii TaxID=4109 RepID=A0A9J5XG42_SOLCO|nr:hypothetical protein H5410_047060 [Solanum commersonii]